MSSYLARFNHQFFGPPDGRKWVFLHGLMGYGLNWRTIAQSLSSTERVLIFDQRGHGRSWKPETGYAPEDFADDLFLILQELAWEKIILVGHSMGGRNALIFCKKFSDKLEKLVIEDIGPDSNPDAPDFYKKLFTLIPTPFPSKLAAKEFFMNEFPKLIRGWDQPETLGAYLYSSIIEIDGGAADFRFSKQAMIEVLQLGRAQDHWSELRQIPVPTLVIRGQNSKELTRANFDKMLQANPRIHGLEIPNAGHWVHSDQPEAFTKALKDFTGL
jgi:esterase